MKYLLVFLYIVFPLMARGFVESSNRSGPVDGDTILHKTIRAADKDRDDGDRDSRLRKRVRILLRDKGHLINIINDAGETPLFLAGKYPLTTKLLLQHGADPNLVNQHDRTVFQDVLMRSFSPQLLKIFFKWSQKRPDVNVVDENGLSILQHLWSQPDMNVMDENGLPLAQHLWSQSDVSLIHEDGLSLLQFLLYDIFLAAKYSEAQYKKDREYHGGSVIAYTISLFAVKKKWDNFFENRYKRKEIALILINEGVDLTYRDPFGKLSLHQAVRLDSPEIAERIIKKGGTWYLTSQDREAIIQLAVEKNYDKIVRLLRKKPFPGEVSLLGKFFDSCHALWNNPLRGRSTQ